MNTKRQINGNAYDITKLVENAISSVDEKTLNLNSARKSLQFMGNYSPDDETVIRYARESAILETLSNETGANFKNQIGKIDFSTNEKAIAGVNSYLNRRITGQHARWSANH